MTDEEFERCQVEWDKASKMLKDFAKEIESAKYPGWCDDCRKYGHYTENCPKREPVR